MEGFVAIKLEEFAKGTISRRQLLETLTTAITAVGASRGASAAAAPDPSITAALVNHISYTCPDFKKAADWYSAVFNLDQVGPTAQDVATPFGRKGDKPLGVTADDVPVSYIVFRTRPAEAPQQPGTEVRRRSQATIEHVGYTVADFDRDRARDELRSLGVENVRDEGRYSLRMTDPFGYDVRISGVASDALVDGA